MQRGDQGAQLGEAGAVVGPGQVRGHGEAALAKAALDGGGQGADEGGIGRREVAVLRHVQALGDDQGRIDGDLPLAMVAISDFIGSA